MTSLRDLRVRQGLTQKQLAELISVSERTIIHWEMGSASPSFESLQRLYEVFGADVQGAFAPRRPQVKRGRKPKGEQEPQE
jgi:transcriptional regulator with XRE-family HTH domain